jgi:pimeloyl-ACP methyl ester carboxylesterase
VHGTGAWSEIWRETMRRLAERGYRAMAADMPPFGFSERPSSRDYTTATQGRRLAALLTRFDRTGVTTTAAPFPMPTILRESSPPRSRSRRSAALSSRVSSPIP